MTYGCVKSKLDGTEHVYGSNTPMTLPKKYSYIKQLTKVLDQGNKPICVPCSMACAINWMTDTNNATPRKDNKINLMEIYDRAESKCRDGMEIKDALRELRRKGIETQNGNFRIERYAMVGSKEHLKQALIANGPCIGALPVYDDQTTRFWKDNGNKPQGGHAIAIVGYDDKGFIIRNSWGTSYGDKGYAILPYEDMDDFYEIWTMW